MDWFMIIESYLHGQGTKANRMAGTNPRKVIWNDLLPVEAVNNHPVVDKLGQLGHFNAFAKAMHEKNAADKM